MELAHLTWPVVNKLDRNIPVVIPIAALEQHGEHLPVFTDSMLLGEIVRRVHELLRDDILVTPLMWLGNSEHHLDFPGTMTASPRVYLDLLIDMASNFLFHDFKTIVLLNGHGGNMVPSSQAMFELRQRIRAQSDVRLISLTYWNAGDSPAKSIPELVQREMGHACEWETSMILRLRSDLVGNYQAAQPVSQVAMNLPGTQAWITKDRSTIGHIGKPQEATAEKGEKLLAYFSSHVVTYLKSLRQN